jgi:hypothetical protein
VFGLLVWAWLRRQVVRSPVVRLPLAIILWSIVNEAILDSVAYTTLQPAFARVAGLESGDWFHLSLRWNIPPLALFVSGVVLSVPLCTLLMRDAQAIVVSLRRNSNRVPPLFAYWILVLPGTLLLLAYLVAFAPWRTSSSAMALGGVLGAPLLSLPAEAFRRLRGRTARDGAGALLTQTARLRTATWSLSLAAIAVLVALTFGPTIEWRRGVAISPPNPAQYSYAAQQIVLNLEIDRPERSRLHVRSQPRAEVGSPFVRSITRTLALTGPSHEGAKQLTEFIARWNLDDATVSSVSDPARSGDAWAWTAELDHAPDSFMIRLWPVTVITDSYIDSLRISGHINVARTDGIALGGGGLVWTRSPDMSGVDSFQVIVR